MTTRSDFGDKCPVEMSAILQASIGGHFRKMADHELDGFAGLEGVGYCWEVSDTVYVVADLMRTEIVYQVFDADGNCWQHGRDEFVQIAFGH